MKKITLFYLTLLFCINLGISQVYNGNLTLNTQADIDAFNYSEVQGNLIIEESISGDILNLGGLLSLEKVEFDLVIKDNLMLNDLMGLNNLREAGNLIVENNAEITNLIGLSSLTSADLSINLNKSLINLDGINQLNTGTILITRNDSLINLDGLSNCSENAFFIEVIGNKSLKNLNGLDNIPGMNSLLGVLRIGDNNLLENGCGITKMLLDTTSTPFGEKLIYNNGPTTSSIDDILNNCLSCNGIYSGDLTLRSQVEIDAFNYCEITGNLTIKETVARDIIDLSNLGRLEKLAGDLKIQGNEALTIISGFDKLTKIETLDIRENKELIQLNAFAGLQELTSILLINNNKLVDIGDFSNIKVLRDFKVLNSAISNIQGLSSLEAVNGDFYLDNTNISNFDVLQNVKNLGNLFLYRNQLLQNINGLSEVSLHGSVVRISSNAALMNLNGLTGLTTLGADLIISRNRVLENLDGLTNLTSVGNRLIVGDNRNLQNGCGILFLLENANTVGGQISIYNNTENTNSTAAIINNCNMLIGPRSEAIVSIYPIPSNGRELFVKGAEQKTKYQVISFNGQVVTEGSIEESLQQLIFTKPLEKGMYFVRFTNGKEINSKKFLVN